MLKKLIVPVLIVAAIISIVSVPSSCTKNPLPVHDTTVVIKTDTITKIKTDTVAPVDTTVNLTKGLVLYLPFNGTLLDSSAGGNTTTAINGAGLTVDQHGYTNDAFATNGGGRLEVSNNGAYKVDSTFSISLDVMLSNLSAGQIFASIVNPTDGTGPTFAMGLNNPSMPQQLTFGINSASGGSTCSNTGDANPLNQYNTSSFTPQIGIWYNIIVTFNRGVSTIYVDGAPQSTLTQTSQAALFCPNAKFVVGGWWDGDPEITQGKFDAVRFYNRVLTPHEIVALAQHFQVNSTKVQPQLKNL